MGYVTPVFELTNYNLAGKVLKCGETIEGVTPEVALTIIHNWRLSHYSPLNTFQRRIRSVAETVDSSSLVAQRIKRMESIKLKLDRFPHMRLTQIQDIGGCRAIVSDMEHLNKLVSIVAVRDKARSSRGVKHKLIAEKDYIASPKPSGYRGVHLIFKYVGEEGNKYNGLKIEIQIRTLIQHAWATAVETVDVFTRQSLKSSIGEDDWIRFFALAASAMAIYEGCQPVPGIVLTPDELRTELRKYYNDLGVPNLLKTYSRAINFLQDKERSKDSHFFLLTLDYEAKQMSVKGYKKWHLDRASADYLNVESKTKNRNANAVLVSADSVAALRKAYPNYFLDTDTFLGLMQKIIA